MMSESGDQPENPTMHSPGLREQLAELMETVWSCEEAWRWDDHIDAAIRYGH